MTKEAWRRPGNYFYIFPTREMGKRALWEKITDDGRKILDMVPKQIEARRVNQEMLLELTNGSTIRILGVDKDNDSIRGITPTGVVFSEFAYSDPDTYKAILPAIDQNNAWQIINSTPNGKNHFYAAYLYALKNKEWYCSFHQSLWPKKEGYIRPQNFGKDHYKNLVEQGLFSWEDIEREWGCSFQTGMKGTYYAVQVEKAHADKRIGMYPYDEKYPVDTFWDLGVDDTTVCWYAQYIGGATVFIDYFEENNLGTDSLVKVMADKNYKYRTHYLPHDAAHRKLGRQVISTEDEFVDSCRAFGISDDVVCLGRTSNVQTGINSVRTRFCKYFFNEALTHKGLKHIELYHRRFDKKRNTFLKDPVHDQHSHAADALRMEAESKEERNDPFYKQKDVQVLRGYDLWSY